MSFEIWCSNKGAHTCHMCQKKFNLKDVEYHMKTAHSTTGEKYYNKYVMPNAKQDNKGNKKANGKFELAESTEPTIAKLTKKSRMKSKSFSMNRGEENGSDKKITKLRCISVSEIKNKKEGSQNGKINNRSKESSNKKTLTKTEEKKLKNKILNDVKCSPYVYIQELTSAEINKVKRSKSTWNRKVNRQNKAKAKASRKIKNEADNIFSEIDNRQTEDKTNGQKKNGLHKSASAWLESLGKITIFAIKKIQILYNKFHCQYRCNGLLSSLSKRCSFAKGYHV